MRLFSIIHCGATAAVLGGVLCVDIAAADINLERVIGDLTNLGGADRTAVLYNMDDAGGMDAVVCDTCEVQEVMDLGTGAVLWSFNAQLELGFDAGVRAFADIDGDGVREVILERSGSVGPPPPREPLAPGTREDIRVVVWDPVLHAAELELGSSGIEYALAFVGDVDADGADELVVSRHDTSAGTSTTEVYGSGDPADVRGEASRGGTWLRGLGFLPNPARGALTLRFDLAREADVAIQVCDIQGRVVRDFGQRRMGPGPHTLRWDGRDESGLRLPAGVYFCELSSPEERTCRQLVRVP